MDPLPYPTDVYDFCKMYKAMRYLQKLITNKHVHMICFEDLLYKYDESCTNVENILGLNKIDHLLQKQVFNPDISINNTQLFRKIEYQKEVEVIEKELKEYLYDFPYVKESKVEKAF